MKAKKYAAMITEVISEPKLEISRPMVDAMNECIHGAAVALFLRAFPEVSARIYRCGDAKAVREIEKIDIAFDLVGENLSDATGVAASYDTYEDFIRDPITWFSERARWEKEMAAGK